MSSQPRDHMKPQELARGSSAHLALALIEESDDL